jgi:cell division protein ZipA
VNAKREVLVINVKAKQGYFKGADLLHILLACDCRFGEMNIFHRYEDASAKGAVQFSVVNMVEPGVFDLDNIDGFSTPGVSFFMAVPGPKDAMQAFDCMVETAQCLVKNLNGELLDDSRSVMTGQTLEHCRQKIRDFERRQLAYSE